VVSPVHGGRTEHATPIDELIDRHESGWSIDRLPDVVRAILRMACSSYCGPTTPPTSSSSTGRWSWRRRCRPTTFRHVNGVLVAIPAAEVPAG
jgi:N utilization substance protein B